MRIGTPCPCHGYVPAGSRGTGVQECRPTMPPDMPDDAGRWLTYAELAEVRSIARESAVRMAQRNHWPRRRNNRGEALVLVPDGTLPPDNAGDDLPGGMSSPPPDIAASALAVLADAVAALREQLDAANARAERAEAGRADLQHDLDAAKETQRAAEGIADTERQRADELRAEIEALSAEMEMVRREAEQAVAEERGRAEQFSEQIDAGHREVDAARAAAQAAERALAEERERAAQAEQRAEAQTQGRGAAETEAGELRAEVERLRAAQERAVQAADVLTQAEAARKARGVLARLRAVWRGE